MILKKTTFILVVLVFCGLLVCAPVWAEDQPAKLNLEDPNSHFDRMANFLANARHLQTTVRIGYDVLQDSGQKIEFSEQRLITIARPDRFKVEVVKSNGDKNLVVFNGRRITAYSETYKVYAETEKTGNLDDALVYFLRDLKMRMPLALMFTNNFPEEIKKRLQNLAFVELSTTNTLPCVHLAGRTDQIDFQVWIAQVGEPLPQRLVITYRGEKGQPQFWADFENWDLASSTSGKDFDFIPPDGTERIPFLAEMDQKSPDTRQKGGD